ncbi:MAG: IS4 family transposase [Phycisphaerae bacterium]|nr:IS4 family transposase [Deltaproteobacteria bacterium]NIU56815.1 IS4 family transposase [Phycisphaerae bacterium]NIV98735.1 IS4 family transposase [Candidatus Saccharibacteria bacterium]
MNQGKSIFSQIMDFLPKHKFRQCVNRYGGNYRVRSFTCFDQFMCMAFAQLTYRESLRDIECCLRAMKDKLYHMGIRGKISRSTIADANENRDWRIYCDFAQILIHQARQLYANDDFGLQLDETVYALDATIIDLCLSVFPWARFRKSKGAIKLHTLLDLKGNIPSFIAITQGRVHEVNILDELIPEAGAIYILDRGYFDFERLYTLHQYASFFVVRAKASASLRRLYSMPVDKSCGLRCDQIVLPAAFYAAKNYPEKLRRVVFVDTDKDIRLNLLTNQMTLPALTIAELYRCRWQVELFFKWIKQHLRIKAFYGTSENAVKTQIWIAISVYVLVAIIKKQLKLDLSLYTILQIFSITLFEKMPILQALTETDYKNKITSGHIQLNLFES